MPSAKEAKCPVCRKPKSVDFAPFCSAGCKDRDLLQWLGEGYKVPGPPVSPDQLGDHLTRESGHESGLEQES
ncbi:DNA gyrase inhibitor YacG [Parasphingorhabdus litoris]|uniref:DNA gyrase inhibitor YacG n=1 Tax=Parasphingorhabdus litoris TaxID=394733 RepID=UPI001E62AA7A|nr:DNA gyrase inhibitor YacG [Parasphingorhabdus litoris]